MAFLPLRLAAVNQVAQLQQIIDTKSGTTGGDLHKVVAGGQIGNGCQK
jgi:hypothetical protein